MTSLSLFADDGRRLDLTSTLLSFDGVVRHLAGGEWQCQLAPSIWPSLVAHWPASNDDPPLQMVTSEPSGVLISGPVRVAKLDQANGTSTVTLSGVDEFAVLASRLVYPQPADAPPWNTDVYLSVTGQASAAVADLIVRNAGSLARTERQLPGLTVADLGGGSDGTWKYRLSELSAAVATIATETGLFVDVRRQVDGDREVRIGATRNRTNLYLDDTKLAAFTLLLSTPDSTTPIAGGSGEGTSRLFATAGDEVAGLARREVFSDQRNIDSLPALQRSADATRASGSASTSLTGELTADAGAQYRWRRDYDLGDTVSLRAFGSTWPVTVSAVTLKADAAGWRSTPVLGSTPKHALAQLLKDVSGLASRLESVEVV